MLGVPFYVMDDLDGSVPTDEPPPGLERRACPPCARRRPRRRARRDPRGRRGDAGSRGVRAAGELQRAPGPPVRAALGDQQDARAPAGRRRRRMARRRRCRSRCRRRSSTATSGSGTRWSGDDEPSAHRRRARLGDGRDRRPARGRRLPARDVQRAGRPAEPARDVAGDRARRASRRGASSSSATRRGAAATSSRSRGSRRSRSGRRRSSARRSTAATCAASSVPEDTRAARFEQGVPYLAEARPPR